MFDDGECRVYFRGELVLVGGRDEATGLWNLRINPTGQTRQATDVIDHLDLQLPATQINHAAHGLYTMPYKQNQLKYMHQSFFNLPIQQITDAAMNGQLEGIPFLSNPELIRKYLSPSPATPEGRMRRHRTGLRSTRNTVARKREKAATRRAKKESEPIETPKANNVFCFAALADKQTGTLYTDQTGALPVRSLEGMQYFFIAYDYDTNYIFAKPISNLKDKTIIEAFESVFNELKNKGQS